VARPEHLDRSSMAVNRGSTQSLASSEHQDRSSMTVNRGSTQPYASPEHLGLPANLPLSASTSCISMGSIQSLSSLDLPPNLALATPGSSMAVNRGSMQPHVSTEHQDLPPNLPKATPGSSMVVNRGSMQSLASPEQLDLPPNVPLETPGSSTVVNQGNMQPHSSPEYQVVDGGASRSGAESVEAGQAASSGSQRPVEIPPGQTNLIESTTASGAATNVNSSRSFTARVSKFLQRATFKGSEDATPSDKDDRSSEQRISTGPSFISFIRPKKV